MLGMKRFRSASITIVGIELIDYECLHQSALNQVRRRKNLPRFAFGFAIK